MRKTKKDPISRAFKQDFPEFVDRVKALGVRISLSPNRYCRVYWLDGYKQLTGYDTNSDGSPFTRADATRNIDKTLTDIEEDRRAIEAMTQDERFARVLAAFRKMKPQPRMIGEVRLAGGDGGGVFFLESYDGEARLHGIGTVARAKAAWAKGVSSEEQMATWCDLLEQDYRERHARSDEAA